MPNEVFTTDRYISFVCGGLNLIFVLVIAISFGNRVQWKNKTCTKENNKKEQEKHITLKSQFEREKKTQNDLQHYSVFKIFAAFESNPKELKRICL